MLRMLQGWQQLLGRVAKPGHSPGTSPAQPGWAQEGRILEVYEQPQHLAADDWAPRKVFLSLSLQILICKEESDIELDCELKSSLCSLLAPAAGTWRHHCHGLHFRRDQGTHFRHVGRATLSCTGRALAEQLCSDSFQHSCVSALPEAADDAPRLDKALSRRDGVGWEGQAWLLSAQYCQEHGFSLSSSAGLAKCLADIIEKRDAIHAAVDKELESFGLRLREAERKIEVMEIMIIGPNAALAENAKGQVVRRAEVQLIIWKISVD
ncbi:hypothetical protein TURU_047449 [Turdus rufiventris]|nr:hypothetical protein TURU_047449 [Turdus rufiventris]